MLWRVAYGLSAFCLLAAALSALFLYFKENPLPRQFTFKRLLVAVSCFCICCAVVSLRVNRQGKLERRHRIAVATVSALGGTFRRGEVSFEGLRKIDDQDVSILADIKDLKRVNLASTSVTDRSLRVVGSIPNLDSLNLYGTQVTDDGLKHLRNCANLRWLCLSKTSVTGKSFPINANHRIWISLFLDGCPIDKQGLECIATSKRRHRHLSFSNTNIDDSMIGLLHQVNCRTLEVRKTQISDAGIRRLRLRHHVVTDVPVSGRSKNPLR